ncbi:MFS transporter [Amycolatopsis sp. NPDC059027]|uniref:MFS transporter n=1 Tax=Amycolatopsis sp. NPDC059027 TaxID=3346709 RepID=UPI00366CC061
MRNWWPLTAVCLGTFMLLLDITIVNVALPAVAVDLHAGFGDLQWVVDGYVLGLVVLLLSAGSLADLRGRRRTYVAGLALFAAASLGCGLAATPTMLVVARGLQGVGGALMFATTLALLSNSYRGRERGIAYGVWGAVNGAATSIGPILGGVLTEHLGWRWIFLVNVPISVVAILLALRVLAESADPGARRVDWAGALTFSVAMAALLLGLIGTASWSPWMYPVAALALAAFVVVERRSAEPMLDLKLFTRPAFPAISFTAMAMPFALFSLFLFLALWLQSVLGFSPVEVGLTFLPLSLVALVVSPLAGKHLTPRLSARAQIGAGLVVCGVGVLLFLGLDKDSTGTALLPGLLVGGLGVGVASPRLSATAMSVVPPERAGMAAGANNTFAQLGNALGIAILGVLFTRHVEASLAVSGVGAGNPGFAAAVAGGGTPGLLAATPEPRRAALTEAVDTAFTAGLNHVFLVAAVVAFAAAAATWFVTVPAEPRQDDRPAALDNAEPVS